MLIVCLMVPGYKASGIGRENGPNGLDAYLEVKSMFVRNLPVLQQPCVMD